MHLGAYAYTKLLKLYMYECILCDKINTLM